MSANYLENIFQKKYLKDLELKGSDPRAATCRGKLQKLRSKLNQEINKELRLRAGAENLLKATTNRKLRDTVALELSFVNSNLQLLKEKLAELNSSMEIYQNDSAEHVIPMIPLGLKETKEVNFMEPFSDFILEHYSENATLYSSAIADIIDTRQAARTPSRDFQGTSLLFQYYNLLYFVERRFFSSDRNLSVYFEWYDSLTGVPSCQRTISFEKACILFNLGAIYTQIGVKHDRSSEKDLNAAVDNFLRAAGVFRHIYDTFTNAPSMDLKPQVLDVLVNLMLAQARECLFEKLLLQITSLSLRDSNQLQKDLAGEASQLTLEYNAMYKNIQSNDVHIYLPECWARLLQLKAEYYKALAYHYSANSVELNSLDEIYLQKSLLTNEKRQEIQSVLCNDSESGNKSKSDFIKRAFFEESLASYEEAQRLQRMCRFLKNKASLTEVLKEASYTTIDDYEKFIKKMENDVNEEFNLYEVSIVASSKFTLSLISPDFTSHKVEDPFKSLGPIAVFSARRYWTVPRYIRLQNASLNGKSLLTLSQCCNCINCHINNGTRIIPELKQRSSQCYLEVNILQSYGFHIAGDVPVFVSHVEINSLADLGGIKEGDYFVEISGVDVKSYTHQQVLSLIRSTESALELKVITPMDRNYFKPISSKESMSVAISLVSSNSIETTKLKSKSRFKSPKGLSSSYWNLFKATKSLDKI